MPVPITTAPASATGSVWARPMIASPAACASPAPNALRRGPTRSGSVPSSSRETTTVPAKTMKTVAPLPIPRLSSSSTTNAAIVP